jgi:hypothetical protein
MIACRTAAAVAVVLGIVMLPAAVAAQTWYLDAYAGGAVYDGIAASVGANNAVLGVRHVGDSWLYLSVAAPLASADPVWSAAGLGRRLPIALPRRAAALAAIGIDVAGHAFGYRDPAPAQWGAGLTLDALPYVTVGGDALWLEAQSGVRHHTATFAGEALSRTTHDSGARIVALLRPGLEVSGQARYVRAPDDDFPYAGVAASWQPDPRLTVQASLGRWFTDAVSTRAWSGGGSYRVSPTLELWASLRQDASDPLYRNGPRRSWGVGVSRRLGGGMREPLAEALRPVVSAGHVTIRLPLAEAEQPPFVAGDFSDWQPIAMRRAGDFWVARLAVAPGVHHYAFRTAGGEWFVPDSVPGRRDDGFGGHVAVLVVE